MIYALYAAACAALGAHIWLRRGDGRMSAPAAVALALAWACPLAAAWLGMDFSPSFTMMFLVANLALCALSEGAMLAGERPRARGKRLGGALSAASAACFAAGMLASLPAVYIYAAGDDWLNACMLAAAAAGAALAAGIARFGWRRGRKPDLAGALLNWLSLSAACFALACALHSPALFPYGAGLLCLCAARLAGAGRARTALGCAGLMLAAAMAVAPML